MEVWYSKLRNWNPSLPEHDWDNRDGRATLAGDAAHPMTFQRGQGLNHALQDAFTVCKAIEEFWGSSGGEGDIAAMIQQRTAVLGAYEAEMKARAGEEVRLSSQNSLAMHDWSLLSKSPSLTKGMTVKKE
jgi:2-polyprenyl-6-methoxyphenol hydroxylase-like FAD-dependent oxidoreductase